MKSAILVGSLRKESFNRKIANAIVKLAPSSIQFEIIEIGNLPFFNEDEDLGSPPIQWTTFRNVMAQYDGVLFVTPEYNRSVPAVLKNAIDVGSRPYGKNIWAGKAGAVISVSPVAMGGFGANHHLRQSLVFLDVPTLQQPEAYIGGVSEYFDSSGKLTDVKTEKLLKKFIVSYEQWVSKIKVISL